MYSGPIWRGRKASQVRNPPTLRTTKVLVTPIAILQVAYLSASVAGFSELRRQPKRRYEEEDSNTDRHLNAPQQGVKKQKNSPEITSV
jgi:hypothetical protein